MAEEMFSSSSTTRRVGLRALGVGAASSSLFPDLTLSEAVVCISDFVKEWRPRGIETGSAGGVARLSHKEYSREMPVNSSRNDRRQAAGAGGRELRLISRY